MNVEIIHSKTKSIKVVRELDDLLFDEGWRFSRNVAESASSYKEVIDNMEEILANRYGNFTHSLT